MAGYQYTIPTTFDPASLPAWARRHPVVVDLARRDLAFRANIFAVTTGPGARQMRRFLISEAEARRKQQANFNAIANGMWPPYPSEY